MQCNVCPRKCNIDRNLQKGFCSCNNDVYVAKYMLHFGEEPIISGNNNKGSGAIFFAGCNLKCIYCQNYEISSKCVGKKLSTLDLVNIFKDLERKGANNINLVSPTQYTLQIIEALKIYKPSIPIVWNSNGYELENTIALLKPYVDIYLVDYKYSNGELSEELSHAKNYPEIAKACIIQMKKNQPLDIVEDGIMKKGVIIRHLVLPNLLHNTFDCLDWISQTFGNNQFVSLMGQYYPCYKAVEHNLINRPLKTIEYKRAINKLLTLGFVNGFTQELSSADKCYTPDFSKYNDL